MSKFKFIESFNEVVDEIRGKGPAYEPECANRVQKEAYICKKLKMSRSTLYETCLVTGIDTMYDALRNKSGAK